MSFAEFSEFHSTIVVQGNTQGSYVAGRFVKGVSGAGSIEGSVQPITGRALAALEIGRKDLGKVTIFTDSVLKISNTTTQENGDRIEWGGAVYEIIQRAPWQNGIIDHYEYIGEYRGETS